MKKLLRFEKLFVVILLLGFGIVKGPQILNNFSLEGTQAQTNIEFMDLQGRKILPRPPYALVFWASWCKPCELELARIQRMIDSSSISADKILAVSLDQDRSQLEGALAERKYSFLVAWDGDGKASRHFKVLATPTVVVVDESASIRWASMGISPSLEWRFKSYLDPVQELQH